MIDAGCDVVWDGMNVTVTGRASKPIHADLEQMPDMLPVMAALACSISGESSFVKGARLRLKESDRLVAVANLVRDLGGTVREEGDDLYIIGSGILKGGQGDCVNDHRLVMAGTLMALISENPVTYKIARLSQNPIHTSLRTGTYWAVMHNQFRFLIVSGLI